MKGLKQTRTTALMSGGTPRHDRQTPEASEVDGKLDQKGYIHYGSQNHFKS